LALGEEKEEIRETRKKDLVKGLFIEIQFPRILLRLKPRRR